jgi:signal transduction histidine kinase/HD-like signal output (HDOD) protein
VTQLAQRSAGDASLPAPTAEQIEMILREVDGLPTLPAIATRLLTISNLDDADLDQIVEIIESDPTLTARVLGLCRTADKGLGDRITTVRRAVVMLGLETVQAALLSVAVFETMKPRTRKDGAESAGDRVVPFDRDGFWRHSLAVASAAELVAERHVESGVKPEEAFVAGLLHDMGKLALEVILPKAYGRVLGLAERRQTSSARAESQLLGVDHHTIGRRLADHWGLPDAIQDVIWLCGQPLDAMPEQPNRNLIGIIWVARALCRELHLGWSGDFNSPEPIQGLRGAAKRMGLSSEAIDDIVSRLHDAVSRRCSVLGLGEKNTPEMLLEALTQANAKLGKMSQVFEQRSRMAARQARVLQAINVFHEASAHSRRGMVGTLAAISRSASSILGEGFVGLVYQARAGEAWQLCRFTSDGRPARSVTIEPPATGPRDSQAPVAALSGLCNPSSIPMQAMGLLSWLADALADAHDLRQIALLPLAASGAEGAPGDQPAGVLIHDRNVAGMPEPALMEPLMATWSSAITAALQHEASTRLQERLASANRMIVETRERLAEAEAMARLGEFAAGAAHEMNNPLTVISGRAQLLAASVTSPADRENAAMVVQHAERLSDLITSLRLIADPPKPRPAMSTIESLFQSAIAAAQERSGVRDMRVIVRVPSQTDAMFMDRPVVASALAELLTNAAQASNDTPVTLEAHTDPVEGRWFLVVTDFGTGMSDKALQHAFDPFFSEKSAGRRTGLGLTRARALIEAHGGEITLASEQGKGTTATIALPVWKRDN